LNIKKKRIMFKFYSKASNRSILQAVHACNSWKQHKASFRLEDSSITKILAFLNIGLRMNLKGMNMNKMKTILALALVFAVTIFAFPTNIVKAEETLLWEADVPSNGNPVSSPMLEAGMQYRIVANRTFWYDIPNRLAADAQYYTTMPSDFGWDWDNVLPAPDGHSFLQINGLDVDWGPFNGGYTGHTYTIYYGGAGESITFTIVDWADGEYGNNLCHLRVEIWTCPMYEGFTPGYWKNHEEAWEGYMTGQLVEDVFDVFETMPTPDHCDLGDFTLMEALSFGGGKDVYGAAKILLRAAVAALLNSAHPDVNYPLTESEVINSVNAAIDSHDRGTILDLAEQLDMYNNLGGP